MAKSRIKKSCIEEDKEDPCFLSLISVRQGKVEGERRGKAQKKGNFLEGRGRRLIRKRRGASQQEGRAKEGGSER